MIRALNRLKYRVTDWLDSLPFYVLVPAMPFAWATLAVLYIAFCLVAPFIVACMLAFQFVRWLCRRRRRPTLFDGTDLLK